MDKRLKIVILGALIGFIIAFVANMFVKDVSILLGIALGSSVGLIFSSKCPKTVD